MLAKIVLLLSVCFSLVTRAEVTSVSCADLSGTVKLQASPVLKLDFYGDTMDVKIDFADQPSDYQKFHQLNLHSGINFRGAMGMNSYVDHLELILGSAFHGDPREFPNATLKIHDDVYYPDKETAPGYKGKYEEERHEYILKCTILAAPIFTDPCAGKTQKQFDTLLLTSAINRSTDEFAQALSCGANVNAVNSFGCSSLMLASETLHFGCGEKSSATDSFQTFRTRAIFSMLLDGGAYTVQADGNGNTVLHKLVINSEKEMLKTLIGLSDDLDPQNNEGMTPLMMAAQGSGPSYAVRLLVEAGANVELKNKQGLTAYDLGEQLDDDTRELLRAPSVGASITGLDTGLCTPQNLTLPVGTNVRLKLVASSSRMFMLTVPAVGVSMMADVGLTANKTIKFDKTGVYPFQCGIMGGSQMSGQITVK